MDSTQSSYSTRFKVGLFTLFGITVVGLVSTIVNDRPFWWKPCQLVKINVEDATGLKTKSPIRSLGIEIGFLKSVMLHETHVTLGICLTAPVEVLPSTRAYIRGEGFLGDKFVELKPVKYLNSNSHDEESKSVQPIPSEKVGFLRTGLMLAKLLSWFESSAYAAPPDSPAAPAEGTPKKPSKGSREIPVGEESQDIQHLVNRVDELVHQMSGLTDNLRQSINPEDLRRTMRQLNQTLENASKTLSPEGGLNKTAQRTLAKLEDSIEQLRSIMTRINKGEGSVGMLLNDPAYAQGIRDAINNINKLLNRVANVQFIVDIGAVNLSGISGGRGWFQVGIWPKPDHYYLLGIAGDSRGRISNSIVTTTAGGQTQTTQIQTVEQTGLLLTGMVGKVFFKRIDLSLGALYGDGAASVLFNLGPNDDEQRIQLRNDIYVRNAVGSFDCRNSLSFKPVDYVYLRAGWESFRGLVGTNIAGGANYLFGAGVTFTDDDIKLLFTLK